MSAMSGTTVKSANSEFDNHSDLRNEFRWIDDMLAVARRIWPRKTATNLAAVAGVTERAAQFWLAGKCGMTLAAARALIRSDHGYEFLVAYVGEDCSAPWFKRTKVAHHQHDTKRAMRAVEKKLEQLRAAQAQNDLFDL